jgi:hypothetical protein
MAVLALAGLARADDILPEYKNVKEGEVFVVKSTSSHTMNGKTVTDEMTMEHRVTRIDREKGTLTYVVTSIFPPFPGVEKGDQKKEDAPVTVSILAPKATPKKEKEPKSDTVQITAKCGEKDVKLRCKHTITTMAGSPAESWDSSDVQTIEVKCGDKTLKLKCTYGRLVIEESETKDGKEVKTRRTSEFWHSGELPPFASTVSSHTKLEGGTTLERTSSLVEVRMP